MDGGSSAIGSQGNVLHFPKKHDMILCCGSLTFCRVSLQMGSDWTKGVLYMIAIGNDHTGVALKETIKQFLEARGERVQDFGTQSTAASNYAEIAESVAGAVVDGRCEKGILICGTGVGISIAANKVRGIRAVCCSEPFSAKLSKQHNNTNILCFGARVVGVELAKMIVECWLDAEFEGGRHIPRVNAIAEIENRQYK